MKRILTTLSEKWPEYLLEILVLIIGIYGAFAVESWSENRKESAKERELLIGIKSDLGESKEELLRLIKDNGKNIELLKGLYQASKSNAKYHPSMDSAFAKITVWTSPFLKSTAYENVKKYGIEFISDKDLKDQLVHIFEFRFPQIVKDYDKSEWTLAESVTYPYFVNRFERGISIATPTDYKVLIAEPEYKAIISNIISLRQYGVDHSKKINEEIEMTIRLIENELK